MINSCSRTASCDSPAGAAAAMAEIGEQQLQAAAGHVRHRLADGRQLGPDGGRRRGIVEADDGQVARHVQVPCGGRR